MSTTRLAIVLAALALMSAGASAQVGIRIGGGGIGLGLMGPPLLGRRDRYDGVERHRAPQRSEHVRRKQSNDDDDVKTAKKTPATQESNEPKAQNENSSVSSIAPDKDKGGPTTTPVIEKTEVSAINENSTISGAALSTIEPDPVKAPVTTADTAGSGKTDATCKRYFPTVGQTLTVPCN